MEELKGPRDRTTPRGDLVRMYYRVIADGARSLR